MDHAEKSPANAGRPGPAGGVTPILKTAVITCLAAAVSIGTAREPGAAVLLLWPSARSAALAGAVTGLADEHDAAGWNPGGLGFQHGAGGSFTYCDWLPGLYTGMRLVTAAGGASFAEPVGPGSNLAVGANLVHLGIGETDLINERGEFLGREKVWRGAFGVHAGLAVNPKVGAGVNLKLVHSENPVDWVWIEMPGLGIDGGGTGTTIAADVGILYRPLRTLGVGLSFCNLGPDIACEESDTPDPLPRVVHVGLCWTPLDTRLLRLRVLPDLSKVLLSQDSAGGGFTALMHDTWKSLGFELTLAKLVTLRAAYFEDLALQRGGFTVARPGSPDEHVGFWDWLTRPGFQDVESIAFCYGIGIGYKDYVRLDVTSDAAVYDLPTSNVRVALVVNDPGRLVTEIDEGRLFDWLTN